MDINLLVKITARAWSLPILALMHEGVPGRQAMLISRTGAGRTAFGQSMTHLIDLRLVERAPGHGHPLRPEFRLTPLGAAAGEAAARIQAVTPDDAAGAVLRRNWTVPLLALSLRPTFYSGFKSSLQTITDRALSQSLKHLQAQDWISREVAPASYPPRAQYRAINAGAQIGAAAGVVVPS